MENFIKEYFNINLDENESMHMIYKNKSPMYINEPYILVTIRIECTEVNNLPIKTQVLYLYGKGGIFLDNYTLVKDFNHSISMFLVQQ